VFVLVVVVMVMVMVVSVVVVVVKISVPGVYKFFKESRSHLNSGHQKGDMRGGSVLRTHKY
jgi:hypothetical protein